MLKKIIAWILRLFKKSKKIIYIEENINLDKWEKLKRLPETYIGDIFYNCKNLDEIAIALAHSDEKTIKRFLMVAETFHNKKERLEILIKDYSITSKNKSDKMKAHVVNYSGIGKSGYIQTTLKD